MSSIIDMKKQLHSMLSGACVCVCDTLKGIKLLPHLYSAYFELARDPVCLVLLVPVKSTLQL